MGTRSLIGRWLTTYTNLVTGPGADPAGAANLVYVTGPSRTADIEQRIELGVHGPREVHVVLTG